MENKFLLCLFILALSGCSYAYADKKSVICETIEECEIKANEGNFMARYALAEMYEKGEKVKQNYARAAIHYSISCTDGYEQACERLAYLQTGRDQ